MITLHTFGPAFGLPDPSPFVVKGELLLKMAELPYRAVPSDVRKAPKGKLPYIHDDSAVVADTTLIRLHLEIKYGIDFDKGLSPADKGVAWAMEKMLEDHLYWMVVRERWMDQENFDRGPRKFFDKLPALMRPLVVGMVLRQVRGNLRGHGLGRHTDAEVLPLIARAVDGLAAFLGDKQYLMGTTACGADATALAFVSSALCPVFRSKVRERMESHANLVAYRDRGMKRWFPDLK